MSDDEFDVYIMMMLFAVEKGMQMEERSEERVDTFVLIAMWNYVLSYVSKSIISL